MSYLSQQPSFLPSSDNNSFQKQGEQNSRRSKPSGSEKDSHSHKKQQNAQITSPSISSSKAFEKEEKSRSRSNSKLRKKRARKAKSLAYLKSTFPKPPSLSEGDWLCGCSNWNFAKRTKCNKCQKDKKPGSHHHIHHGNPAPSTENGHNHDKKGRRSRSKEQVTASDFLNPGEHEMLNIGNDQNRGAPLYNESNSFSKIRQYSPGNRENLYINRQQESGGICKQCCCCKAINEERRYSQSPDYIYKPNLPNRGALNKYTQNVEYENVDVQYHPQQNRMDYGAQREHRAYQEYHNEIFNHEKNQYSRQYSNNLNSYEQAPSTNPIRKADYLKIINEEQQQLGNNSNTYQIDNNYSKFSPPPLQQPPQLSQEAQFNNRMGQQKYFLEQQQGHHNHQYQQNMNVQQDISYLPSQIHHHNHSHHHHPHQHSANKSISNILTSSNSFQPSSQNLNLNSQLSTNSQSVIPSSSSSSTSFAGLYLPQQDQINSSYPPPPAPSLQPHYQSLNGIPYKSNSPENESKMNQFQTFPSPSNFSNICQENQVIPQNCSQYHQPSTYNYNNKINSSIYPQYSQINQQPNVPHQSTQYSISQNHQSHPYQYPPPQDRSPAQISRNIHHRSHSSGFYSGGEESHKSSRNIGNENYQ